MAPSRYTGLHGSGLVFFNQGQGLELKASISSSGGEISFEMMINYMTVEPFEGCVFSRISKLAVGSRWISNLTSSAFATPTCSSSHAIGNICSCIFRC